MINSLDQHTDKLHDELVKAEEVLTVAEKTANELPKQMLGVQGMADNNLETGLEKLSGLLKEVNTTARHDRWNRLVIRGRPGHRYREFG